MEKDWKDKLRNSLENYSEEVPAGLWEDVLKGVVAREKAAGGKKRPVLWFSTAGLAVAASLALFFILGRKDVPLMVEEIIAEAIQTEHNEKLVPAPSDEVREVTTPSSVEVLDENPAAEAIALPEAEVEAGDVQEEAVVAEVPEEKVVPAGRRDVQVEEETGEKGETLPWALPEDDEKKARKMSLSVAGAGTAGSNGEKMGYTGFNGSDVARQFVMGGSDLGVVEYENTNKAVESSWSHKMPVRVTLNASWRFHPRFRLTTGLTYSLLLSELKSGSDESYYKTNNTLHYLGIPLSVDFSIWRNRRWDFYLSAGGVMEKCIAGKTTTKYIADGQQVNYVSNWLMDDPLQWSVKGGAGVQVMLGRIVGLYLEPMVTYHFDNGSYVENVYKERPFNFGLNFGVRFEF